MNTLTPPSNLRFILVKAGSTELEEQGRLLGSLDLPLSQSGQQQASRTSAALANEEIQAVYSSASLAAKQTARVLSEDRPLWVRVEEKLTNLDCGLWHGMVVSELKETHPRFYRHWLDNPEQVHPPEGETVEEVRTRVTTMLNKIQRKHKQGCVAIVASNPLLSIIRSEIDGRPMRTLDIGNWDSNNLDDQPWCVVEPAMPITA